MIPSINIMISPSKMNKNEIAEIFEEIAHILTLQGANPFRVRAYRNAARSLLNLSSELGPLIENKELQQLEGIGADLASKIETLFIEGKLPFYEKLKKSLPSSLLELLKVRGLGSKRAMLLYNKLKIKSLSGLKKACREGKVAKLPGFGEKTEKKILNELGNLALYSKRMRWWDAFQIAQPILEGLLQQKEVTKAEIAGSLRRKLETVGDLDFIVAARSSSQVMRYFTTSSFSHKVIASGKTKSTIRLKNGLSADLRVVTAKEYPFALCYFTGSQEHNIQLRKRALEKGFSLNEYGMQKTRRNSPSLSRAIQTEKSLYKALGLSFIPPELRENQGEFEAGSKGEIPKLIEEKEIRGTFHNHTLASDGKNSLKEMLLAAQKLHWEYLGIADHSKSSYQANGLHAKELEEQIEEIQKINRSKKYKTYLFSGVECDILPSGKLDFPNSLLKELDYVVVSVHSSFQQDEKTMTQRIIRAIENPYTTILAHPTGRLLLEREGYQVDLLKVIDACIANHKLIEINASPYRLDMDWRFWHAAKNKGLKCVINTDAHSTQQLKLFSCGVNIARKGWLEKKDVINTLPLKKIQKFLTTTR